MAAIILIIVCGLIFPGVINMIKAKASGRKAPGVLQPIYDIGRLFKKGSVYSTTTSIIFQIAPAVYFTSILTVLLFIPFPGGESIISFQGDFLFFAYLLALGKFMMIISALDTGSGFEGMGANREALYSALVEPAFFVLVSSLAMLTGFTSFSEIFAAIQLNTYSAIIFVSIVIYLLFQITLIENSRLPIDDPKTHLELTMVHEVIILDNSGFDLAIIQLGNTIKFGLYGALIANILLAPAHLGFILTTVLFICVQYVFAVCIGLMESFRPRFKMAMNPKFILTLTSIAIISFFTVLIIKQKIL